MNAVLESILGSRSATLVLLFLENYGEGHASRIAKTFNVSVMGIQRQLKRLEESGVLLSRMVGSSRIFTFNDTNPTVKSLRALLDSELKTMPKEYTNLYFGEIQKPQRREKAM